MLSCLPGRVAQILGNAASGVMSCVCSVACASEERPQFLTVALKVVFSALSILICQCRVSATEMQLLHFSSNPAVLGTLSCEKPGLT